MNGFVDKSFKKKGWIVDLFDYLTVLKKKKFVASLIGVKPSSLYTIRSSIAHDLFFVIDKEDNRFLAVSGYDRKPILIGFEDLSMHLIDTRFEPFESINQRMIDDMLTFLAFLDISSFKPVLHKTTIRKYLIISDRGEYCFQKNTYIYKNKLDKFCEYYSQDIFTIVKDNQIFFIDSNIPQLSLSVETDAKFEPNLALKQDNHDLDIIYDGLVGFFSKHKTTNIPSLHSYDVSLKIFKEHYLDTCYKGWKEFGFPQTNEDIQVLKMIAI